MSQPYNCHMAVVEWTVQYDPAEYEVFVVEKRNAPAVHELLGQLNRAPAATIVPLDTVRSTPVIGVEDGVEVEDNGPWTLAMIRDLAAWTRLPLALGAIDVVAAASPMPVAYHRLVEELATTHVELRGELISLTRLCRNLFKRKTWPMTARQGLAGGNEMGYVMRREVADWWLAARGESAAPAEER